MYSQIADNKRKTWLMMLGFLLLVVGVAYIFGSIQDNYSMTVAVSIGAVAYALIQYFAADKLAVAMNGAHQITKRQNPRLWRVVENLSLSEGMPMPRVYVIDDPAPNAFATGRDPQHALVAATTGLLDMMTDTELEGVMAHELGHVKNYDIRVGMMAFGLVSIIGILSDFFLRMSFFGGMRGGDDDEGGNSGNILGILAIVAAIVAPILATLIQLAISRRREYLADATGALTTRYPEGLAKALAKIGQYGSSLRRQNTSTAHLFFANPLSTKGAKGLLASLFSTHPPIQERIDRLMEMKNQT